MMQSEPDTTPDDEHHYCCVECLAPSPTLYRRYTTHASVKLTRCPGCGLDVDPYVEREAMLVAFDIVLHRIAAYRHVLFNRNPFADFCPAASVGRSVKFALGLSILDAYIKFEALRFRLYSADPSMFLHLLAWSFLEQMALVIGTILAVLPLLGSSFDMTPGNVNTNDSSSSTAMNGHIVDRHAPSRGYIISRILLAIMLPSTFKAVTIFVHIWENSPTTRALGSVFVASMQWIGVHCCMERVMKWIVDAQGSSPRNSTRLLERMILVIPGCPLIGGFILRLVIPFMVGILLNVPILMRQCSGVHVLVSFGNMMSQEQTCLL